MSSKNKMKDLGSVPEGRGGKYKRAGLLPVTDVSGVRKSWVHERAAARRHLDFMWLIGGLRRFRRYSDGGASLRCGDRLKGKRQRAARKRNR